MEDMRGSRAEAEAERPGLAVTGPQPKAHVPAGLSQSLCPGAALRLQFARTTQLLTVVPAGRPTAEKPAEAQTGAHHPTALGFGKSWGTCRRCREPSAQPSFRVGQTRVGAVSSSRTAFLGLRTHRRQAFPQRGSSAVLLGMRPHPDLQPFSKGKQEKLCLAAPSTPGRPPESAADRGQPLQVASRGQSDPQCFFFMCNKSCLDN